MPIKRIIKTGYSRVPVKIWTDDADENTTVQLEAVSSLPFVHSHVASMPDCHWGNGTAVGTVLPTIKAIVPAAVGVDLGCGMQAMRLGIRAEDLPDSLAALRAEVERTIPHGRTDNGGRNDRGAWDDCPSDVLAAWPQLSTDSRFLSLQEQYPKLFKGNVNSIRHLCTLGTGNHFLELCLDLEGNVWLMLHSGSRGIGNRFGQFFINLAKEEMERWHIELPDNNLAYLPEGSQYFDGYWQAVSWAQDFAALNRQLMMERFLKAVSKVLSRRIDVSEFAVNCHHNYVALEHHYGKDVYVTRKGAVRARKGDLGIIPGSMGAKSFIVRGLGNPESFCSCSHGAGRKMSRTEAKKRFTKEDLIQQTQGVECRKDSDVIDEIPGAYKSIDEVMENQTDLVEVVAQLKQLMCVKG